MVYLTAQGEQMLTADGADHRAEITMRDSASGLMREYYPSGKLWRVVPLAHVGMGIRHGVAMSYDEAGKLRKREEYVGGHRQGEVQLFDASGALSRTKVYQHDKLVSQQCFTATGQATGCQEEKHAPQYPEGMTGLMRDIQKAVVLPPEYMVKRNYGIATLKFIVDEHAKITGATVLKAPSESMGQAVLDALKRIAPFQAPPTIDGENVAVIYTLPIKLGAPPQGWNMPNAYYDSPKVNFLTDATDH
ncbi:energy transducer TonB [Hymenobacter convexus]|uniref:energy transducer TonB n=1 Tax=Hymenobacter sp. CA1UV-4 TaxID=3063782 RepID=UPI002712DF7B|nr:energy transducer TonB [Hymenobacter sp. CA1UV-4]MDO7852652.1 energy transducer TonB [Hymenobacter sp. CA1UV-4]